MLITSGNHLEPISFLVITAFKTPVRGYPWFFFLSKDKSLQPCIYYRGLDNITIKNKYPLPLISSAFEPLQGAQFFTELDLQNAYHFARIREGDEWKMAFNTLLGPIEYLVMPFGFTNTPAVSGPSKRRPLKFPQPVCVPVHRSHSDFLQEHMDHVW